MDSFKPREGYSIVLKQLIGRSEEKDFGIKAIPETAVNCFSRPSLITFGGNQSNSNKRMRGFAKRATRLSGVYGYDEVGIFGALYEGEKTTESSYTRSYNSEENQRENYSVTAYEFARKHILPLVSGADGQKLDIPTAKRNLRNINILTWSFGALVVEEIGNATYVLMERLGYSEEEIKQITSQVLMVSLGSEAELGSGLAEFTRATVFNSSDWHLYEGGETYHSETRTNASKFQRELNRTGRAAWEMSILRYSEREIIIGLNHTLSSLPRSSREGGFFTRGKNEKIVATNLIEDPENHYSDLYLVPGIGKFGFFVPGLLSNLLSAAVDNSLKNAAQPESFTELPKIEILLSDNKARADTTITRKLLHAYSKHDTFLSRLKDALVAPLTLSR